MALPAFRPSADWSHLRARPAAAPRQKTADAESSAPSAPEAASSAPADGQTSSISSVSSPGGTREHPIPEDSILADYRDFVRTVSEMPDGPIIAPILSLCGRLLTPDVVLDFGGRKPLTLYNFVTSPAGLRKSTTFGPAEKIARQILMSDDMIYGNASDSALFDTFEQQPHRLQFEDEGHTLLRTWETSAYGREVSARYLKLYDGTPWTQNFLRERKLHEGGNAERTIPQATLSLCIASTFGVAQLSQLEAGSGLRRRFGFYMATQKARRLLWPESLDDPQLEHLGEQFRDLTHLKGTIGRGSFTPEAWDYWAGLQARNHERTQSIPGYTSGEESLLSSLNESPARCLKLAIIFQACRWARDNSVDPYTITADVLALAEAHQNACLDALMELESTGRRWETEDTSEWLLAQISGDHPGQHSARYTRAELTRRFAHNSGRSGALTPSRLHGEIISKLIERGQCHTTRAGRTLHYTFHWDP